jgi:hypothetical protein
MGFFDAVSFTDQPYSKYIMYMTAFVIATIIGIWMYKMYAAPFLNMKTW